VIDPFIQAAGIRSHDCQEGAIQVLSQESAQLEFDLASTRPLADGGTGIKGNYADASARVEQAADLGLANFSGAHYEALPAFQFQKHWE
jgi:hypothetical protein